MKNPDSRSAHERELKKLERRAVYGWVVATLGLLAMLLGLAWTLGLGELVIPQR